MCKIDYEFKVVYCGKCDLPTSIEWIEQNLGDDEDCYCMHCYKIFGLKNKGEK